MSNAPTDFPATKPILTEEDARAYLATITDEVREWKGEDGLLYAQIDLPIGRRAVRQPDDDYHHNLEPLIVGLARFVRGEIKRAASS